MSRPCRPTRVLRSAQLKRKVATVKSTLFMKQAHELPPLPYARRRPRVCSPRPAPALAPLAVLCGLQYVSGR